MKMEEQTEELRELMGTGGSAENGHKTKNEEKQNGGNEKPEVFHPPFV